MAAPSGDRPGVSFVTVGFGSSRVLAPAIASLRREAAREGLAIEIVVVDHSESEAELERLAALRPERLVAAANRGYAAGVNRGVALASGANLLIGNPDIELEPGALGALLAALAAFDVVGPQFVLGDFLLPPADVQSPLAEWRRLRAARSGPARRNLLRREVARWQETWEAATPRVVPSLSGALLACSRETAASLGPWDERYFLYFEETDWLRRARRAGRRIALVPGARVLHRWGHAADAREPSSAAHFARSRRLFYGTHFGALGRWLARPQPPATDPVWPPLPAAEQLAGGARWWLVSPSRSAMPAAGARLPPDRLPAALARLAELSPALVSGTVTAWGEGGAPPSSYAFEIPTEIAPAAPAFVVRGVDPGDEAAIERLFVQSFGHAPPPGHWQWKYAQAPARTRRTLAVDRHGALVAHAGALAFPARVAGRDVDIWQLVDFMGTTANSGLRPPLVAAGRSLLADLPGPRDAPWIFGFPSRRHFRLGERAFGYRPLFDITPLSGELPAEITGAIAPSAIGDRAPLAAEEVWRNCGLDGVVRSREFLDWRYWARPGRYYRFYSFGAAGQDGFAVFAFQNQTALAAEFWMARREAAFGALLAIAADLRAAGFRAWSFWPPLSGLDSEAVAALGLAPVAETVFVGIRAGKAENALAMAGRFHYAMGDFDLV